MIKITQITPLLKSGWIAQDKNGDIYWYENMPFLAKDGNYWGCIGANESFKDFGCLQDIEPWAEDWIGRCARSPAERTTYCRREWICPNSDR